MKKLLALLTASLAFLPSLRADTSYLLIQGNFGAGGSLLTSEWQVNYTSGSLITSIDLLKAVFGAPVDTGTTYQGLEVFSMGNNILGASFVDFASDGLGLFATSFTINGVKVEQDFSWDPGWILYSAGGSGSNTTGSYPSDVWTHNNEGASGRSLSNGSFDGWLFGETGVYDVETGTVGPADTIAGGTGAYAPTPSNFAGATVINYVPEPSSVAFLSLGGLLYLRRRR